MHRALCLVLGAGAGEFWFGTPTLTDAADDEMADLERFRTQRR